MIAKGNQKKPRKQLKSLPWQQIPLQDRTHDISQVRGGQLPAAGSGWDSFSDANPMRAPGADSRAPAGLEERDDGR